MKQERSDKYSVAWFKLAECISRREKERALGVYRLLSHSFDNVAIAYQLEGDILCAFDLLDEAIEQYEKAAKVYQEREQYMQAVSVYEHLYELAERDWYLRQMIELWKLCNKPDRVREYSKRLCLLWAKQSNYDAMTQWVKKMSLEPQQLGTFYGEIVSQASNSEPLIKQIVESLAYNADALQQMLQYLKMHDEQAYEIACSYTSNV